MKLIKLCYTHQSEKENITVRITTGYPRFLDKLIIKNELSFQRSAIGYRNETHLSASLKSVQRIRFPAT